MLADLGEHGVRQHLAGGEVALGTEVVARLLELHRHVDRLEDLEGLGGHLRADAVAGDDGEGEGAGGGRRGRSVRHAANVSCRRTCAAVSRRSSEAWTASWLRLRGFSGWWLAGPQSGYMSYMASPEYGSWVVGGRVGGRRPGRGGDGSWITRGREDQRTADRARWSWERDRRGASGPGTDPEATQRRTPRRGGLGQASPRQSMSTNRLRMVRPRYAAPRRRRTGFDEPFTMRDGGPA